MTGHARSECRGWHAAAELLTKQDGASLALLGAPLAERSLTPGRCDLAPGKVREVLKRFSVYDLEAGQSLDALKVFDAGDLDLKAVSPADAFTPIRDRFGELANNRDLALLIGGNNAVTWPGVHALGSLERTALITLDAHFDLRDTDCGPLNGNPVKCLIEDGLPGANIVQIGMAPFANTRRMHETAKSNGISVFTASDVRERGILAVIDDAIEAIAGHVDRVYVDFDIDVIDRSQCPGAPGARPGGMAVTDFFAAARRLAAWPKVKAVDLTEYDPGLDVADITALTAGRWVCEILSGYAQRG